MQLGANETLSSRGPFLDKIANKAYDIVLENKFDRNDEMDAGQGLVEPGGEGRLRAGEARRLPDAPRRAEQGSAGAATACSRRIPKRRPASTPSASRQAPRTERWWRRGTRHNVKYKPTPVTAIATVEDGASGLTGSAKAGDKKEDAKKEEEPKKKGFGLGGLKQAVAPEKQSAQVSASGGSRGVGPRSRCERRRQSGAGQGLSEQRGSRGVQARSCVEPIAESR